MKEDWEAIIGIEIHAQLATKTKLFCNCATSFGAEPNSHTCPVCLGLPGALPVLNKRAVELAARAALALGLNINKTSIFSRKNYFYPDLPKGYQISQYKKPFSSDGKLQIMTAERRNGGHAHGWKPMEIGITRLHIEEDAGKNVHEGLTDTEKYSYIDLNRAGTPLAEIVTDPDFKTSWQAYDYVNHIRHVIQWVGASEADMEKGNLRCEANVSVRKVGQKEFNKKVELKNLNSVRFMQKAIEYEIERQIKAHENGKTVNQETRLWDEKNNQTRVMRSKEDAHDYRYFPEPDLQPLRVSAEFIENAKASMPELPNAMSERFQSEYELNFNDAFQLVAEKDLAEFYEITAKKTGNAKASANWILVELMRELNNAGRSISDSPITAEGLAELIKFVDCGKISGKQAKAVLIEMYNSNKTAERIVKEKGLEQISNVVEIEKIVNKVIANNEEQAEEYRHGNQKLLGFFVGQVMKASQGKANPKVANEVLRNRLRLS